ncbi:NitT/TauT family transport system permease protein [Humitalea rosea]|uniref:NitT/TauT family transport system permease protein n=1 Tax=Humitalea rosea TaxID=990373 RepID=A0A2W7IMI2_9PROT|nr:ABC transporter permease [Humitalea rosea]PZW48395.1 NitT/TauT family transport system permease protein [Humitalea rosea]
MKALALLAPLALIAAAWEGSVALFAISPFYLPPLRDVLGAIGANWQAYQAAFLITLLEAVVGFVAGGLVGVGSGIVFAHAPRLKQMVLPIFIVSQTVPVIAFGAIIVLWFGNTLAAKAAIAFYLTFFPVTVNTLAGMEAVDPRQIALLRSFGAGRRALLWKLLLPSALPRIFTALRLSAGLALAGAIVGEWFGAVQGVGALLLAAMFNEQIIALWAAIILAAAVGGALFALVAVIEARLLFWREEL